MAYKLWFYEIVSPDWMFNGRQHGYDVTARIPPGTDMEHYRLMLQNLLAERFHLVFHREAGNLPGYALRLGKHKPKLTPSAGAGPGNASTTTVDAAQPAVGHFSQL